MSNSALSFIVKSIESKGSSSWIVGVFDVVMPWFDWSVHCAVWWQDDGTTLSVAVIAGFELFARLRPRIYKKSDWY